jgi:hypothetical protein
MTVVALKATLAATIEKCTVTKLEEVWSSLTDEEEGGGGVSGSLLKVQFVLSCCFDHFQ